jgi:hypothetical protein
MIDRVAGTEGYAEQAEAFVASWRRLAFTDRPREVLDLFPTQQSLVADIIDLHMDVACSAVRNASWRQ